MSSPVNKKLFFTTAKTLLFVLILWVLYNQIWNRDNLSEILSEMQKGIHDHGYLWLMVTCLVMPINWGIESAKWKSIVNQFQKFSFQQSVRSVLAGVTMAIWTPARIGEYGGRLIGIDQDKRGQALVGNFVSSLSQNIVNLSVGLLATVLFLSTTKIISEDSKNIIFTSGGFILMLLTILYFRLSILVRLLDALPARQWIIMVKEKIEQVDTFEKSLLIRLLTLSSIRYSIYLFQYILLILFFSVTQDIYIATIGVATVFFIQSNLPLPPVLSVLARGELAILLWSVFTANVVGILAATFTLWVINLGIPALIGLIYISRYTIDNNNP